jgi:large subunit ribosomal protein L20
MPRVKRGTKRRARRKKYLKRTKGFFLTKSKLYQSAQEAANRADRYAKRDRRVKKRQYRRLWIQRVGAAARLAGLTYGQLINGLKVAGISIDRKKIVLDHAIRSCGVYDVDVKLHSQVSTKVKIWVVAGEGGAPAKTEAVSEKPKKAAKKK